jgi:hypothetical protein
MKKSLSVIMLLLSTVAGASEITKEQYIEQFEKNKKTYENVEVGMTSEYRSSYVEDPSAETKVECIEHEKEIVVSKDYSDKYLVYKKSTRVNDCGDGMKGKFTEQLKWRKLYIVDHTLFEDPYTVEYKKITLNGSIVKMNYTVIYPPSEDSQGDNVGSLDNLTYEGDLSKSQFYMMNEFITDNLKSSLLRRGFTDPSTINLENIEIEEMIDLDGTNNN